MSSMMRSPCVYIYLPHIYLTDQEGGYTLYDTDASQYIFIPYYGRYIVYWRINEFKWCPVARRLLCPPCIYTYNNNSLPRKKSSYHHRLTHKKTIFLFFFFFSGRAIVNKTRRLMAFLFSPFFLTLHTHTHTHATFPSSEMDGATINCTIHCRPLWPSEAEVFWLPPSSPAGSACLSSKGIVNSICRAREREQLTATKWLDKWASKFARVLSSHLAIIFSFSSSSSPRLCRLSFLSSCVDTIFHPSAHTHTRRQTHTHSFVLLCWPFFFFLLLALSHLYSPTPQSHSTWWRIANWPEESRWAIDPAPLSLLESWWTINEGNNRRVQVLDHLSQGR